jgi:hypothetical protein
MPLPRTVLTALSIDRPGPRRIDPDPGGHIERSQMSEMPRAVCFPHDDDAFAERVQACLDGSHGEGPFPAAIQALLRETHPLAVVTPRSELGAIDGARVWYTFRDGSVVPAVEGDTS